MISFLRLVRISNLIILALGLYLFYYLILIPVHHVQLFTTLLPLTNSEFLMFVVSVALVAAAGNIINDYFDFELDKEFKANRPLPSGKISLDVAIYLHGLLAFAGIALGFYLGWKNGIYRIGYVYIIAVMLLFVYSSYLKKLPLAGNILVAGLAAFPFLLIMVFEANFLNTIHFETGSYAFSILLWQIKFYAGFAFIANLAREVVKDMEDKEGDAANSVNTMAVEFGNAATKWVAGFILFGLMAGIGYFIYFFCLAGAVKEVAYLVLFIELPVLIAVFMLYKANAQADFKRLSLLLKVIMVLGIMSILAFYLFHNLNS